MRKIAAALLEARGVASETDPADSALLVSVRKTVREWLASKGAAREVVEALAGSFSSVRGAPMTLATQKTAASAGHLESWTLAEELDDGTAFRTMLSVGLLGGDCAVHCTVETGFTGSAIAPLYFDPHLPHVFRSIAHLPEKWMVSGRDLVRERMRLIRREGGERLAALISGRERRVPLVVVSEDQGFPIDPDLDGRLAQELLGVAMVASIDEEAAWEVTRRLGQHWSCFNGAVRLYWPRMSRTEDHMRNPLWTASKLLEIGDGDTVEAAKRIRRTLRRRLLEVTCYSVWEPALFWEIRGAARREEMDRLVQAGADASEVRELAQLYLADAEALRKENAELHERMARLETDVANERLMREHAERVGDVPEDVAPTQETPPQTIAEATDRARRLLRDHVTFGLDVEDGVRGLHPSAGPPDKILAWLTRLAECAEARRAGTMGTDAVEWLRQRGVRASGESQSVCNNRAEYARRRWRDGEGKLRQFDFHLKPREGTSPDQCVRIYAEWEDASGRYLVGWIGRHP